MLRALPGCRVMTDNTIWWSPSTTRPARSMSGFIVAEEGTASSFRALAEVIDRHGLFCELHTDRGSHYFHTPKAGEAVSKTVRTAVPSAPSARSGTDCRRSRLWPASPRSRPPIAGSPRAIGRRTMPPSQWPRPRPVAPLSAIAPAGRLRPCEKPLRWRQTGCVSRFGSRPVAQPPQKRSIDALRTPVNLTRQQHWLSEFGRKPVARELGDRGGKQSRREATHLFQWRRVISGYDGPSLRGRSTPRSPRQKSRSTSNSVTPSFAA
jgi:hypothetical protein